MSNSILISIMQFILSSLMLFLIMTLLIEFIFLFIKNPRIRSALRLLPLIKLPLDLVMFQLYKWNVPFNINPFSCEKHLFKAMINFFSLKVPEYYYDCRHFSLSKLVMGTIPSPLLLSMVLLFSSISLLLIAHKICQHFILNCHLKNLLNFGRLINERVTNIKLLNKLNHFGIQIITTDAIHIPCATNPNLILFPNALLKQLSQEEFEAIVAHELEHIRWKDPFARQMASLVSAFFWWVPSKWWISRMEEEQELACDLGTSTYDINNHTLATAFVKTISRNRKTIPHFFCYLLEDKKPLIKRLENILNTSQSTLINRFLLSLILLATLLFLSLFSFWFC